VEVTTLFKISKLTADYWLKNPKGGYTNESISWTKTWATNDNLVFDSSIPTVTTNNLAQDFNGKIPANNLGVNYLKMNIIQSSATNVTQDVYDSSLQTTGYSNSAQSFTAPITGTLTTVQIYYRRYLMALDSFAIYTNSAGLPGTKIADLTYTDITPNGTWQWVVGSGSISVTSGTTYWIVADHDSERTAPFFRYKEWAYNSSSVIAGNRARSNGTWTAEASQDHAYKLTIEPTPSTNIDWSASYKPLYL
jgi:hypothetical protein